MRKRTRVATVLGACAVCVLMAGGAAYALAPSIEEAQELTAEDVMEEQASRAFSDAYISSAKVLELCGVDENGNMIAFQSGSPSITGATAQKASSNYSAPAQGSSGQQNGQQTTANTGTAALPACTLEIFGNVIPYVGSYESDRAPDSTAGLWMGSDSTTDGSWGYFIGHHPGVFNCVMYLSGGDQITVCDANGNARTYTVFNIYDVPDDTQWSQISGEVTSHGESIVLQTCVGDHQSYRIVEAA